MNPAIGMFFQNAESLHDSMNAEFTAVVEKAEDCGYWAYCAEIPGANGQGDTIAEAKTDLAAAVRLILTDRVEDCLREL